MLIFLKNNLAPSRSTDSLFRYTWLRLCPVQPFITWYIVKAHGFIPYGLSTSGWLWLLHDNLLGEECLVARAPGDGGELMPTGVDDGCKLHGPIQVVLGKGVEFDKLAQTHGAESASTKVEKAIYHGDTKVLYCSDHVLVRYQWSTYNMQLE